MSDERWAAFVGVASFALLRAIDYLLPSGRHARWIERWSRKNESPDGPQRREDERA